MRVPSTPPWRTRATSVVPPPTSMNSAPAWLDLLAADAAGHGIGLGHDGQQLQVQLAATVCSAPRWMSGAKALKMLMRTWRPWKPTGLVTA